MLAFVFPGQGSQEVGMGRVFYEAFPRAREVFEEVDEALHIHLSRVIFEGPPDTLNQTLYTQPALMVVSLAILTVFEEALNAPISQKASFLAGHSLGEYTALCAAGTVSISDAARLLFCRGKAMQQAVAEIEGAMTAILGLSLEDVDIITRLVSTEGDLCSIANDNCPGQIVISGHRSAVENACKLAEEKGARRIIPLSVSVPSHCALMAPAVEEMKEAFSQVAFRQAQLPIIANVTAMPMRDPFTIQDLLLQQLTCRVRWRESIENLKQLGVTQFVEIGTGRVLTGLIKRIDPDASLFTLNHPDDLDTFIQQGRGQHV